jgi:prepilin-type N-terminal cleavage/methylation domain-containing protein
MKPNLIMKRIRKILINDGHNFAAAAVKTKDQGFSLVEVIIAMTILMISLLGVFATFTYAVNYNAGNNARSQALAILQEEVELLRSKKFTPNNVDSELTGGKKTPQIRTSKDDGNRFKVQITVDDDPTCPGIQPDVASCVLPAPPATVKEITVTVTLDSPTPGWQSSVPAKVILRRVRGN